MSKGDIKNLFSYHSVSKILKRPTNVIKAKLRPYSFKIEFSYCFFTCMGSLECARTDFATVSKFQDQKGRYCQSNLKVVFVQLFWPRWSDCTLFVINISTQDLILIGHIKYRDFKSQNGIKAAKNLKIWLKAIKQKLFVY